MNYDAERAMNQKRLRMEGEPGHGVVQGNGLPLNYIDNGHQIPYQPYASAYNTHYPPPDAFAAYGPPPPGGYAPQNLSYAPPAHQNYAHHQSFPPQQPTQAQIHMAQSHMVQGYGDVGLHKAAWPPQPHLLPPLDTQKPLDIKQLKPEIKLEPTDTHKRPHPENEMMSREMEQPKIKIKTDIFKPDELVLRPEPDKPHDASLIIPADIIKPVDPSKDDVHTARVEADKPIIAWLRKITLELHMCKPNIPLSFPIFQVTTVDSSSSDDSSGSSESGSEESDDRGPGRPKVPKSPKTPGTPGKRGRPPVPPELRQPGITDMKKFCKAAGIRFDYKKLVEGCTKNKERVEKMQALLVTAGLEGKPTLEKCRALKQAKMDKKEQEKQAKKEAKATKHKETEGEEGCARRMTRGATGVKPRQRIVISSDEEDGTPAARRTLSKLRSSVNDESDSD
ncbi:jg17844 [Pararge aegeria aegeria]|uniref:Jg17844 protein n=1 Tax=Pararge aegeria aegeria TaxID=348720 RepID=A0A8S4SC63_9NEOP|nr:jg17844 [Pararge aegeria aegeria]